MKGHRPVIILITVFLSPAFSYTLDRRSCFSQKDTCSIYDNPNLIINHVKKVPIVQCSRSSFFFPSEQEKKERIMKNINYGYLNLQNEKPIRYLGDLMDMSSDEINLPAKPALVSTVKSKSVIPWKLDEVSSYRGAPKVLPDVMLTPEDPKAENAPNILTEKEKQLGRSVVQEPIKRNTMQDREYLIKTPREYRQPGTIILSKVIQAPERPGYFPNYFKPVLRDPNPDIASYVPLSDFEFEESNCEDDEHTGGIPYSHIIQQQTPSLSYIPYNPEVAAENVFRGYGDDKSLKLHYQNIPDVPKEKQALEALENIVINEQATTTSMKQIKYSVQADGGETINHEENCSQQQEKQSPSISKQEKPDERSGIDDEGIQNNKPKTSSVDLYQHGIQELRDQVHELNHFIQKTSSNKDPAKILKEKTASAICEQSVKADDSKELPEQPVKTKRRRAQRKKQEEQTLERPSSINDDLCLIMDTSCATDTPLDTQIVAAVTQLIDNQLANETDVPTNSKKRERKRKSKRKMDQNLGEEEETETKKFTG